jgi:hypothetical protein
MFFINIKKLVFNKQFFGEKLPFFKILTRGESQHMLIRSSGTTETFVEQKKITTLEKEKI